MVGGHGGVDFFLQRRLRRFDMKACRGQQRLRVICLHPGAAGDKDRSRPESENGKEMECLVFHRFGFVP